MIVKATIAMSIDLSLLEAQKQAIIASYTANPERNELLDGVLHLLDHIQDTCEEVREAPTVSTDN